MMPKVSSMVPLHLSGQDDQKEMQPDIFGHVMSLTSPSAYCDADGISNGTSAFV